MVKTTSLSSAAINALTTGDSSILYNNQSRDLVLYSGSLGFSQSGVFNLEINNINGECLKLKYNSSPTNYVDFNVTSTGQLNIIPNGTDKIVNIYYHNESTSGLSLGGTLITASANELNKLDGVTATTTELNYVDTTQGIAEASKALIVDANRDISNIRNLQTENLTVNGTLVTSSATELNYNDITTIGTAEPGKALVVDVNRDISNIRNVELTNNLTISNHNGINKGLILGNELVSATASEINILDGVIATTSEINKLSGVTATASEINKLSGVTATTTELNYVDTTPGTVEASKAVIVDANRDITNIRNLQTENLTVNGTLITASASELNYNDLATIGTAEAGKALVVDINRDISNIRNLTATNLNGTLQTTSQPNITSVGTLTELSSNGNVNITQHNGSTTGLQLNGSLITATANEINVLDGITTTTEELNILDGVTANANEINVLDGITASTAELNILDGVTATYAELNVLDGITASTAELNYVDTTPGTAEVNKALIVDSNKDISSIRNLTATNLTGILQTSSQPNITSVGTLSNLTLSGPLSGVTTISASGVVSITNTSTSSSTSTGALRVSGGVGIGGATNIGGLLSVTGAISGTNITGTSLTLSGAITGATTIGASGVVTLTNGSNSTNALTGALRVSGGVGIGGALNVAGAISGGMGTLISLNLSGSILGATTIDASGIVTLSNNTTSTTASNGALVVSGGVGISGALNVTGNISGTTIGASGVVTISNSTISTSTTTGALVVTGGIGIGGGINLSSSILGATTIEAGGLLINSISDSFSTSATPSTWTNDNSFVRFKYGRALSMNYDGNDLTFRWSGGGTYGRDSSGNPNISIGNGGFNIYQTTTIARPLILGGDNTSTYLSWGISGVQTQSIATTYTDRSNAGTVSNAMIHSYARPTIASVNARTIVNSATLYIDNSPLAGENTTITNSYALLINNGKVLLNDSSLSTSINSGALIVSGGVGISGSGHFGHSVACGQSARTNLVSWGTSGIQFKTGAVSYTTSSTGTLASNVFNSFARPTLSGSMGTTATTTEAATVYIDNSPLAGSNMTITNAYSLWINSGITILKDTTASTTTSDGALVVSGGVGIGGALNINGTISSSSSLTLSGSISGATTIEASGIVTISNTTESISTTTGALMVSGGVGINGRLNVGNTIDVAGPISITPATKSINGTSVDGVIWHTNQDRRFGMRQIDTNNLALCWFGGGNYNDKIIFSESTGTTINTNVTLSSTRTLTSGGIVSCTNTSTSTSKTTGALLVTGGVGIGGSLYCNSLVVDSGSSTNLVLTGSNSSLRVMGHTDNVCYIQAGNGTGTTGSSNDLFIGNYGQTTSTSSRKFIIKGTTGNVGIGTSSPNYLLDVNGNANIGGTLNVGSSLTVGIVGSGPNIINFSGTTGDATSNHTVIAERIYNNIEKSELLLFKGGDIDVTNGPDRIRLRAAEFVLQTYTSNEDYSGLLDNNNRIIITNEGNIAFNGIQETTYLPAAYNTYTMRPSGTESSVSLGFISSTNKASYILQSGLAQQLFIGTQGTYNTQLSINSLGSSSSAELGNGLCIDVKKPNTSYSSLLRINNNTYNITTDLQSNNTSVSWGTFTNHQFSLMTNNINRLLITTSGNVGIGTSSPEAILHVAGSVSFSLPANSYGYFGSGSTNSNQTGSKNISATFDTGIQVDTAVYISSDVRIKNNINNIENEFCKNFIKLIDSKQYYLNSETNNDLHFGYIAQDLLKAGFGELINFTKDDSIEEYIDNDNYKSPNGFKFQISYSEIIPILHSNIKLIYTEKEVLENKVDILEQKNNEHEIKIQILENENTLLKQQIQDILSRLINLEN